MKKTYRSLFCLLAVLLLSVASRVLDQERSTSVARRKAVARRAVRPRKANRQPSIARSRTARAEIARWTPVSAKTIWTSQASRAGRAMRAGRISRTGRTNRERHPNRANRLSSPRPHQSVATVGFVRAVLEGALRQGRFSAPSIANAAVANGLLCLMPNS